MSRTTFLVTFALLMFASACKQDAAEAPATADTAVRIVFLGDSITEAGVQPDGYITLVSDSLKRAYPDRAIEVIGAGISGNKVPDLQARLERDVLVHDPTHVVIYIGINDVWHFYEFDAVTGTEEPVFESGLHDLITKIEATGAEVLLCTPSVIGEDPASDTAVNQRLMAYADILRGVAEAADVRLGDLRAAFEEYLERENRDKAYDGVLTTDGVHLNPAGNRFVADFMIEQLSAFLNP